MKKLILISGLLTLCISIQAQRVDSIRNKFEIFSVYRSPEAVFLKTDRDSYKSGGTIWFEGDAVNLSMISNLPESNLLYVELLGDALIKRVMIRRIDGIFNGYLEIPSGLSQGVYVLRAYTNWSLNFPPEYMFHKRIAIAGSAGRLSDNQKNLPVLTGKSAVIEKKESSIVFEKRADSCYFYVKAAEPGLTFIICNDNEIPVIKELEAGKHLLKADTKSLPEGLNRSLLLNRNGKIICERLFFNFAGLERWESYPGPEILLNSSLVEPAVNSDYYFDKRIPLEEREMKLDSLLASKKWRDYGIWDPARNASAGYGKEYDQTLSGEVKNAFGNPVKDFTLEIFAPMIMYTYRNDYVGGRFEVKGMDFPDSTRFYITAKKAGSRKGYFITIDEHKYAPYFDYRRLYRSNSISDIMAGKLTTEEGDSIELRRLKEIYIKSKHKELPKFPLSPFGVRVDPDRIKLQKDLVKIRNRSLAEYIVQNYPGFMVMDDKLYSGRSGRMIKKGDSIVPSYIEPLVYINGIKEENTASLFTIKTDEVESVAVLRGNEGAIYGTLDGIIMVTLGRTLGNDEDRPAGKNENCFILPGWQNYRKGE